MTRRAGILIAGVLLLAVAGCSDSGGGDENAFCDNLEALSDQVADGDTGSEDGLEDLVARANDLIEVAGSDQEDAVRAVGEELSDADPDDAADTAEFVQDELGDIAEDVCEIDGDEFAAFEVDDTTTTSEVEDTTTTGGDETTTTQGGGGGVLERDENSPDVGARQPVPADIEQEEDFPVIAQACFDGDPEACDDLFLSTPVDSVAEDYGATCGGRVVDGAAAQCATLMTAPVAVPGDVTDTANAQACFGGDMAACDAQFNAATPGSIDQIYGGLCGGRVRNTTAFCVDIFGPQSFL
jgi:hypothetical protein